VPAGEPAGARRERQTPCAAARRTDAPPGRSSHGCISLHDEDIARLWQVIETGTPIDIA
jgi:L,D-transpeptidase catalytic domain